MIVTIDGPAGAGKSTVARALAGRLGFRFLDTGAMYRAVAYAAIERGHDWERPDELVALAERLDIDVGEDRVLVDGQDVTEAIRTSQVTRLTHYAANNPGVRRHLVELQRREGEQADIVTEGRDQGTVVFPDAACKIFLTASPEQRARRRMQELDARGEHLDFDTVLQQQDERDRSDSTRDCGPLVPAPDAVEVCTDDLSLEEVIDRLEHLVNERRPQT